MRYDQEKEQKLAALEAELARHARRDRMALAVVAALAVTVLALLLAHLLGLVALTDLDDPATERVVLDPMEVDPSGETNIDWFVPSPDGSRVALKAGNGETIAVSGEGFKNRASALNNIKSVQKTAPDATVDDTTDK